MKLTLIRFVCGAFNALIYSFSLLISKTGIETNKEIKKICNKYDVIEPYVIIRNAKNYASTHSEEGPDLEFLISTETKDPTLLLLNTLDKINKDSDLKIYLESLIENTPKVPTLFYVEDLTNSHYFSKFYNQAVERYDSINEVSFKSQFDQQVNFFIKEFSQEYFENEKQKEKNCTVYLKEWVKVLSFHDARARAIKNATNKRESLNNVGYEKFRTWDQKFRQFYKERTKKRLISKKKRD